MEESLNCDHLERSIHLSVLFTKPCPAQAPSMNRLIFNSSESQLIGYLAPYLLHQEGSSLLHSFVHFAAFVWQEDDHVIIGASLESLSQLFPYVAPQLPVLSQPWWIKTGLLWVPLWKVMPRMTDWQVEVFFFFWGKNISRVMLLVFAKSPESSREWRVKIDFLLTMVNFLTRQSRGKGRWRLRCHVRRTTKEDSFKMGS